MAIYEDIVKDMGPPPERPWNLGVLGFNFNEGAMEDWRRKKAIYDAAAAEAAKLRTDQALNPLRGANVGQIADLMGTSPEEIASPDQYRTRQLSEPSAVPSYRYVPTMSQDPSLPPMGQDIPRTMRMETVPLQGPPDIMQRSDNGPIEWLYPSMKRMVPEEPPVTRAQGPEGYREGTPQLRRVSEPLGGVLGNMPVQPYSSDAGRFKASRGPDVQYSRTEVDRTAPSNLFQQTLGMAGVKREGTWPRGNGSSAAVNTLTAKAAMLRAAGVPEDEIARVLAGGEILSGGLKADRAQQQIDTGKARQENLEMGTKLRPKELAERTRHNKVMEQFRRDSQTNLETWRAKMQEAQTNKDWLQLERLNEARYWHDQLMGVFGSIDKGDILSDEQQQALTEGLGIIKQLEDRPITPEEMKWFEGWFGIKPSPRYKYTPRPPVQPPARGTAPPMSRSESQSGSRNQRQSSAGVQDNDAAELAEAKASAAGQKPGAQYQTKSGKIYTWDGADFKPAQ